MRIGIRHIAVIVLLAGVSCTPAGRPSATLPEPPPQRVRMFFGGDVMQHLPQVEAARSGGGFDYSPVFEALAPRMHGADIAVVNLETTLTSSATYSGYPMFRSPVVLADALREAGVDVAVLANNHCCDGGARESARRSANSTAAVSAIRASLPTAPITAATIRSASPGAGCGSPWSITPTGRTAFRCRPVRS